jgi:hypothetical protein
MEYTNGNSIPLILSVADIRPFHVDDVLSDYDQVFSNEVGILTHGLTNVTWHVDLETLLGNNYNKYDLFNIQFAQFISTPNTINGQFNDKYFDIQVNHREYIAQNLEIGGLDFVNCTYTQKRNCNTKSAHLCSMSSTVIYDAATGSNIVYPRNDRTIYNLNGGYENGQLTFRKQKNVSINIKFTSVIDGTLPREFFQYKSNNNQHFILRLNISPLSKA